MTVVLIILAWLVSLTAVGWGGFRMGQSDQTRLRVRQWRKDVPRVGDPAVHRGLMYEISSVNPSRTRGRSKQTVDKAYGEKEIVFATEMMVFQTREGVWMTR